MIEFAQSNSKKVNKHSKFDKNFDIWCQVEHSEYDMNRTKPRVGAAWQLYDVVVD